MPKTKPSRAAQSARRRQITTIRNKTTRDHVQRALGRKQGKKMMFSPSK